MNWDELGQRYYEADRAEARKWGRLRNNAHKLCKEHGTPYHSLGLERWYSIASPVSESQRQLLKELGPNGKTMLRVWLIQNGYSRIGGKWLKMEGR